MVWVRKVSAQEGFRFGFTAFSEIDLGCLRIVPKAKQNEDIGWNCLLMPITLPFIYLRKVEY